MLKLRKCQIKRGCCTKPTCNSLNFVQKTQKPVFSNTGFWRKI